MFVARGEWYSTRKSRVQIRHFVVLAFNSVLILFLEKYLINLTSILIQIKPIYQQKFNI